MTNTFSALPDPTSYIAVGFVLFALVTIVWGFNQVYEAFSRFKEKPTPADAYVPNKVCAVSMEAQEKRVTRLEEDMRGIRADVSSIRSELNTGIQRISREAEERASRLHRRIDPLIKIASKQCGVPVDEE